MQEHVESSDIDDGAERHDGTGEFSPGKNLDAGDGEIPLVVNYASEIIGNWQIGVDAFMKTARLCADANACLTATQKSELMASLPFGAATFSKFVQIGADARLNKSEIQRLLPPHYTLMYAVTLLTDDELEQAIAKKVIKPDMKREELRQWLRTLPKVKGGPSDQQPATNSNLSIVPTQGAAVSDPEIKDQNASTVDAGGGSDVLEDDADGGQSTDPDESADKSARLADDCGTFERLKAHWEEYVVPDWRSASEEIRARFRAEVLGYVHGA